MRSITFYKKEISALVIGGLLALAFAPISIYPLAIICPALLLLLWLSCPPPEAFRLGLLFGVGFFGIGVSWVFISIHEFGNTSLLLSSVITALFILILALFPAFQGYLLNRFFAKNSLIKLYLIFPSTWVLSEWLRSYIFTGFPWLLLGASQVNSPLRGYAPLLGEFGLAFLVTFSASLLLTLLLPLVNRYYPLPLSFLEKNRSYFFVSLLSFIILWTLGYVLSFIPWSHTVGKPITVSLVQANIPQKIKWEPSYLRASLAHYQKLTALHYGSRIIIWPEAAIPSLSYEVQGLLKQLGHQAKRHGTTLITGIPIQKGSKYYNGMIALGVDKAVYYKQRLVIFGEYLPWWIQWARGLFSLLDIPMSSFSPGPSQQSPFKVAGLNLGTFICYEIAYPYLVRQKLISKATLLLTINDDAWFGHSFALAQHLQIGQFQALATGRFLVFLSNTGLTAFINPQGQIIDTLPPFEVGVLTHSIYKTQGRTPWVRLGDCPIIIFLVGLCFLCYAYQKR